MGVLLSLVLPLLAPPPLAAVTTRSHLPSIAKVNKRDQSNEPNVPVVAPKRLEAEIPLNTEE